MDGLDRQQRQQKVQFSTVQVQVFDVYIAAVYLVTFCSRALSGFRQQQRVSVTMIKDKSLNYSAQSSPAN